MLDIGVNLTSSAFDSDREQVLNRAWQAGLTALIITGSSVEDSENALQLSRIHPNCFCTAGVHPHHASTFGNKTLIQLSQILENKQVKAVGETGLDFNRNFSSETAQVHAFEQQLQLACEKQLPIFLHQRDAHATFYPMIKAYRDQLPNAVLHCFTGSKEELFDYLDLDLHIGITGWICDERRGEELQSIITEVPLNRLMLESDAPYLLPRNMSPRPKSRRNEPAYLPFELEKVSECLSLPAHQIAEKTTKTARIFFNIDN